MDGEFGYKLRNNHQIQGNRPKTHSLNAVPGKSNYDSIAQSSTRAKVFLKPMESSRKPVYDGKSYFSARRPVPYRRPPLSSFFESVPSESIHSTVHHHQPLISHLLPTSAPFLQSNSPVFPLPSYTRYQYFDHPFSAPPPRPFAGFHNHDLFEDVAASKVHGHFMPEETRVAVESHPELTEKQRDALIKILESYYKLLHQFNIDFRRLINESRLRNEQKKNETIVLEPIRSSSEVVPMVYTLPKFGLRNRFYRAEAGPYLGNFN